MGERSPLTFIASFPRMLSGLKSFVGRSGTMGLLFRFRESPFLSALRVVTMVLDTFLAWKTNGDRLGRSGLENRATNERENDGVG